MYLFVLIHIVLSAPVPYVDHMQVISFHQSASECQKVHNEKMAEITADNPLPTGVNLGCVPLNGRTT